MLADFVDSHILLCLGGSDLFHFILVDFFVADPPGNYIPTLRYV